MNILFLSPGIYPCITGGVEIFNYHLIKGLSKKGHKIWVVTNCKYNWEEKNVFLIKLNEPLLINPTISNLLQIFKTIISMNNKVDILHVPYTSNTILIYPILLSNLLINMKYVITIHGGGMHPWKPKLFHRIFFKKADVIVGVSEIIKEEYERRTGKKILIRGGRASPFIESFTPKNELRKRYGFNNNDMIILSVGTIKRIKGSDILLNSFLNLDKSFIEENNIKLIYVGEGPMKSLLIEKVKEKKYDNNVIFFGAVPHEEIPDIYKLADIYIIPSLFEGRPQSLLDAMFSGLAIIGADVKGINNLIQDGQNGLLFKKENLEDLSHKIIQLVENKNLRKFVCNNAIKSRNNKKDRFESVITQYENIYKM